jgi:Ca-activated chloride channel family protein
VTFETPLALLALAGVPVAALLYVRGERRGRAARDRFVAPHLLPALLPARPGWRRHATVTLHLAALAALVVALARPQTTHAVPVEQASVVIATDRSGSMLAKDVSPSRLVAARRAAESFLDSVPGDLRVGAVAFNHQATVLQSPTRDHDAVKAALRGVRAAGSTATGDALAAALKLLRDARRTGAGRAGAAPAAVVLLSDGKSVRGRDALEVAGEARRAKIPVYTVALGTAAGTLTSRSASGAVVQRNVPPDPQTLREVAQRTGGRAYSVADAGRLDEVYKRLGSELATERRPQEVTSLFAGGALLLVCVAVAASIRWFGRFV